MISISVTALPMIRNAKIARGRRPEAFDQHPDEQSRARPDRSALSQFHAPNRQRTGHVPDPVSTDCYRVAK